MANWPSNQHQKHLVYKIQFDSFDIKLHIVSEHFRLVSAVISLLEQHKTQLFSLHLEVGGDTFSTGPVSVLNCCCFVIKVMFHCKFT